jgi:hypothetical protein
MSGDPAHPVTPTTTLEGYLFLKRSVYLWEVELRSSKIDGLIAWLSRISFTKSESKEIVIGFPSLEA